MRKLIGLLAVLVSAASYYSMEAASNPVVTPGTQQAQALKREVKKTCQIEYYLYLPKEYDAKSDKKWPLIMFLHGMGERGTNLAKVKVHGPPKVLGQKALPFIVVSPQCPEDRWWQNDVLNALLDEIGEKYAVDTNRVYLTGLSMGGFGTWSLGLQFPERFAAIAPICGGGLPILPVGYNDEKKEAVRTLGVWAFHGAKDPVVKLEESQKMVDFLKNFGGKDVQLTVYPEAEHDSWTVTYDNPRLYEWFLEHSREKRIQ